MLTPDILTLEAMLAQCGLLNPALINDTLINQKFNAAKAQAQRELRVFLEPTEILPNDAPQNEIDALVTAGTAYYQEAAYDYDPNMFNGDTFGESLYTLLSVNFPKNSKTEMLLFNLDIQNICASGGSACSSGAQQGSHVIAALKKGSDIVTVRFSFSKYNTKQEIDKVVQALTSLL